MDHSFPHKLVVIGGGPAGLTAALYGARAGLKPLVIEGATPGGQLMLTSVVENFPGFVDGIQGPALMASMRQHVLRFGATLLSEDVTSIDVSAQPFRLTTSNSTVLAHSVIVATGAKARWLNLPNEQRLIGKGVSSCATCDGYFFRNKSVAVVGGGDAALEEALFLATIVKDVTIIHRRDTFRASNIMQEKINTVPNISIQWNASVVDVLGDDRVTGIILQRTTTHEQIPLAVDGLFVAIGHDPATSFLGGVFEKDPEGYLVVRDHAQTNVPGVFSAGDVHDAHYRQAITAAGFGCMAALEAERYLRAQSIT